MFAIEQSSMCYNVYFKLPSFNLSKDYSPHSVTQLPPPLPSPISSWLIWWHQNLSACKGCFSLENIHAIAISKSIFKVLSIYFTSDTKGKYNWIQIQPYDNISYFQISNTSAPGLELQLDPSDVTPYSTNTNFVKNSN